jgi:hypothetical protein
MNELASVTGASTWFDRWRTDHDTGCATMLRFHIWFYEWDVSCSATLIVFHSIWLAKRWSNFVLIIPVIRTWFDLMGWDGHVILIMTNYNLIGWELINLRLGCNMTWLPCVVMRFWLEQSLSFRGKKRVLKIVTNYLADCHYLICLPPTSVPFSHSDD